MKRSLVIVLGALALAVAVLGSSYLVSQNLCQSSVVASDDLGWLRQEFQLGDAEMARIRTLHEGYLPKCVAMCREIDARKHEVEDALSGTMNVTDAARKKLGELALLRAQCQSQMLQHFLEVSQAMPPEQGRRYFAEMKRVTLGAHDQVEESMSGAAGQAHGHE